MPGAKKRAVSVCPCSRRSYWSGRRRRRAAGIVRCQTRFQLAALRAHEAVEGAELGLVIRHAFGELCRFRANSGGRLDPVFLQIPVPTAHLFPALETADLYVRRRKTAKRRLGFLFLVALRLIDTLQLGVGPGVDAGARLGGDGLRGLADLSP